MPGRGEVVTEQGARRGGFALGTLAGCVWAVPIAWRTGGASFGVRYLLLAAACVLIAGPLVFALRSRPAGPRVAEAAIAWAAALGAAPLALMGTVLKAQTHHRQLGGATFAFAAVALVLVGALFIGSALGLADRARRGRALRAVLWVLSVASVGYCAAVPLGAADSAIFVELLAGFITLLGASKLSREGPAWFARAGIWAWAGIVVAGFVGARCLPEGSRELASRAPLTYGLTVSPQK
jgi:hypothetical protein